MKRCANLVVLTLLLLLCGSAFAENIAALGFVSNDMTTQYCDLEEFVYGSGLSGLATGVHILQTCDLPANATMIGAKVTLPPSALPVTGDLYMMADAVIDAECDCFTGDQAMLLTQTKGYNIHAPHFGWEALYNTYDAFYAYLDNWGYLINELAPPAPPAGKTTKTPSVQHLSRDRNMMNP